MKAAIPFFVFLPIVPAVHAQTVVQVSGGGGALDAAAQTAPPGSVFVVQPGNYDTPAWTAQDATIVAPQGATLRGFFSVRPSAGSLAMRNIRVVNSLRSTPFGSYPDPGTIAGTDVDMVFDNVTSSGITIRGGSVVASECVFVGDQEGAELSGTTASFSDCRLSGGTFFSSYGPFSTAYGGMAILDSRVRIERCSIRGAGGTYPGYGGASGISARGNSTLTVVGSDISGGSSPSGSMFGTSISVLSTVTATLFSVQLTGPVFGQPVMAPLAHASWLTRDLRLGGLSTASFVDASNVPVAVVASFGIAPLTTPLVGEQLFVFGNSQWFQLAFGSTDAMGEFQLSLSLPNQPTLQHRQLWLTGLFGGSLPLRSTAPLGGIIQ